MEDRGTQEYTANMNNSTINFVLKSTPGQNKSLQNHSRIKGSHSHLIQYKLATENHTYLKCTKFGRASLKKEVPNFQIRKLNKNSLVYFQIYEIPIGMKSKIIHTYLNNDQWQTLIKCHLVILILAKIH